MPSFPALLLNAIGLAILFVAGWWGFGNYRVDTRGLRATGTVVEFVPYMTDSDQREHYIPKFRFVTATGQTVEFLYHQMLPDSLAAGDTVSLSYDPSNPEGPWITGSPMLLYFGPIFVGAFGLLLLGAAALTNVMPRGAPRERLDPRASFEQRAAELRRRAGKP
jgi:hypothetical protein